MVTDELLERLYGRQAGWYPWRVFVSETGRMQHAPGLNGMADPLPDGWPVHGYRGVCVRDYRKPADAAHVLLCWAGLDIDYGDNKHIDNLVDKCCAVLADECIIRTSKSGRGVHAILVLRSPLEVPYSLAASLAKNLIQPRAQKLTDAGVVTCVSGLPNLWLWSATGLQRTVVDNGYTAEPSCADVDTVNRFANDPYVNMSQATSLSTMLFSGLAASAVHALIVAGVVACRDGFVSRKQNVNIGAVKRALVGLVDVKTKSKCRPEHSYNINGFIEFTVDGGVRLFSNPDQAAILVLHSL
jgi:hypothetical protein